MGGYGFNNVNSEPTHDNSLIDYMFFNGVTLEISDCITNSISFSDHNTVHACINVYSKVKMLLPLSIEILIISTVAVNLIMRSLICII